VRRNERRRRGPAVEDERLSIAGGLSTHFEAATILTEGEESGADQMGRGDNFTRQRLGNGPTTGESLRLMKGFSFGQRGDPPLFGGKGPA